MATLADIRTNSRSEIAEPDIGNSHYPNIDGLDVQINMAVRYIGTAIAFPRQIVEVAASALTNGTYALSALSKKNLVTRDAYWGDKTINRNIFKLDIVTEEIVSSAFPNWLETSSAFQGKPKFLIIKEISGSDPTLMVIPPPSADFVVAGQSLFISQNYYPSTLVNSTDVPELPLVYHDIIPIYVAHLCYAGGLKNPDMAKMKLDQFNQKLNQLRPIVTKEAENLQMRWPADITLYEDLGGIIP